MAIDEKSILAVGDILLKACSNPKGLLRPWKPFDVATVARQCIEAYESAKVDNQQGDNYALALAEIREVWAGAECGEPIHAQEAYAINLCKQMYQIAVDALAHRKHQPTAPDKDKTIERLAWALANDHERNAPGASEFNDARIAYDAMMKGE